MKGTLAKLKTSTLSSQQGHHQY